MTGTERMLDCEAGRRMGCATFCCRLIVRLAPGERDPGQPERADKRCVDKDPEDGRCVHLDRSSGWCTVWERRPLVCRGYDCNGDPLLQIVLRDGFVSLRKLVTTRAPSPDEPRRYVPERTSPAGGPAASAGDSRPGGGR